MRKRRRFTFFAWLLILNFIPFRPVISCTAGQEVSVISLHETGLPLLKSGMPFALHSIWQHAGGVMALPLHDSKLGLLPLAYSRTVPRPRKRDAAVMAPQHYQI